MRTSDIRQRWLDYFAKQGHHIAPSVPLVSPDPSILFTIAGMVPFIPYIIGSEPAPWPRVASVQKCIRTNDIEEVGKTTRHGTFFQMNGNFSFGDYFKEGAINYAWDLLTTPVKDGGYGLDGDRIWVTIWENDKEAHDLWVKGIGLDPKRVQPLVKEDIFWDTGQPGPAGPCAEIHYDRGPGYGPEGGPAVDLKGDRFLEIWNLVFDQYMRGEGSGKDYPLLGELDFKSIDTGLGLERLAFLMQGKENMYEIDEVYPVIKAAEELSGKKYALGRNSDDPQDVRMRVVADHVRSSLMLINDGVRPGNDGRGYVLRRLLRRAIRSMRLLGVEDRSLPVLLPASMNAMKHSYPELVDNFDQIEAVAYGEEDSFIRTLASGTTILDTAVERVTRAAKSGKTPVLSGKDAFKLHDTYGFPIDLTLEMAGEHGVSVDETAFRKLMNEQRERARADALAKKAGHVDTSTYHEIYAGLGGGSVFTGYTETAGAARVAALLVDGQGAPVVTAPADVDVILDRTPFWAQAGGQLADRGTIRLAGGGILEVNDVQAPIRGLSVHRATLVEGQVHIDEEAYAEIDTDRRIAISRAHTATHMVQQSLREHLGKHATQAGSENAPSRMRFDFRHGQAIPAGQMEDIEATVNEHLLEDLPITDTEMAMDEALEMGAMALFGEKYGERVRVVSIGDWSHELCGGTHMPSTGTLGRVMLLGESSISSGVRRVDALVGDGAYRHQAREHALVGQLTDMVGARPEELAGRVSSIMERLKKAEKELAQVRVEQMLARAGEIAAQAKIEAGVRLVANDLGQVENADQVRQVAVDVRERLGQSEPGVTALAGVANGRPVIVVATNELAREHGIRAGALVKTAAKILGGGGGGKDDLAQGGGTNPEAVGQALAAIEAQIAGRE